jgi:peptidoglycan/LPS O-acetylase OafA/YrhL
MSRVARILPGYLVSLVMVAFAFAPIAYVVQRGSLDGFLTSSNTPLSFVFNNALLKVQDYSVAGTLADVPYAYSWNGSLWSLYFEFLCYVIIGVVAIVPVVRRSPWPIVAMFGISVVVQAQMPTLASYTGGSYEFTRLATLLPFFLGGAVVFVLKERCPLRGYFAVPGTVVSVGVVTLLPDWGPQLVAPLFTYTLLWIASVLPSPSLVKSHDLSYGVYVYAWPVTQLLVLIGAGRYGWVPLVVVIMVSTLVLATLSWLLVERPAKDLMSRRPTAAQKPPQPTVPQPRSAGQEVVTTELAPCQAPLAAQPSYARERPVTRNVPVAI